jgi:hypothetical protein
VCVVQIKKHGATREERPRQRGMTALEKQGVFHELFKADLTVVISAMIKQLKQTIMEN